MLKGREAGSATRLRYARRQLKRTETELGLNVDASFAWQLLEQGVAEKSD